MIRHHDVEHARWIRKRHRIADRQSAALCRVTRHRAGEQIDADESENTVTYKLATGAEYVDGRDAKPEAI